MKRCEHEGFTFKADLMSIAMIDLLRIYIGAYILASKLHRACFCAELLLFARIIMKSPSSHFPIVDEAIARRAG